MAFIQGVDPGQQILFPPTVDEYVSGNNPVRFLAAFVDSLDFDALGFGRSKPAATGRPGYAPRDLLALYIYGYLYKLRSSRVLERECERNVELMWLLRKLTPDFKTIADFRRDNGPAIRKACREFTLLCKKLDLFGAELIAIDGSKFLAVNSRERNFSQEKLRKVIQQIDERVAKYLERLNSADAEGASAARDDQRLAEKIAFMSDRLAEARVLLGYMEEKEMSEISLTDPESRRMKSGAATEVCYNAQIAVDAKHHMIVVDEVTNDATDKEWLAPIAIESQNVLDGAALDVVADRGYSSTSQIKTCVEQQITPYVPRPHTSANEKHGLFTKENFRYDAATDTYTCPADQTLRFRGQTQEQGRPVRYYVTTACSTCPLRDRCTRTKRGGRRITRHADEAYLEQSQQRVREHPEMMLSRKRTVEHVFGTMKRWFDARHFLMRGLHNVKTEFSLTALAYNLRRALNLRSVEDLIAALG